ncbi:transposase [Candidatus Kaiserbacteria bacterium]|nr:transposase [Candidatus Kaiserbacteria bacterium]
MTLYHIYNRGVEKRTVFLDDGDRARFVHGLYVFNDRKTAPNYLLHSRGNTYPAGHIREPLVKIHAWCLMPNHYHLLISATDDDAANISLFAQKLGMGYARFFNEKYSRTGYLWQGTYRKKRIERDAHFLYMPFYIHLNPLDLSMPAWRQGIVKDIKKAITQLHAYRWSSFQDYMGMKNFPSVIETSLLSSVLGAPKRQEKEIARIISSPIIAGKSRTIEM